MKSEEIIEGNKLIAEFTKLNYSDAPSDETCNSDESYLKYYSSWDWIFPVIEKIASLGFEIEFNIKPNWDESTFSIYDTKRDNTLVESPNFIDIENCNSLIQYVWICIVEFIQYYNQNK